MKRIIFIIFLAAILGGWLWIMNSHFSGMNSLIHITGYKQGLLEKRSLPGDSVLQLPTTFEPAVVKVDTLGIPHIFGKDASSAAYALGYMHARDRYFQMELLAHTVMGRLSEVIGVSGVTSDRDWKPMHIETRAQQLLQELQQKDPDLYQFLLAYTDGVNACRQQEDVQYNDPMYLLWNYKPQQWKPYYSLLIQWYLSARLAYYDDYTDRQELLDKLPLAVREVIYPDYPGKQDGIVPQGPPDRDTFSMSGSMIGAAMVQDYSTLKTNPRVKNLGSNNWVVGPSKTSAGGVLLCNDLHLFLTAPNVFYEAQLQTPQLHVYGYTIPGVPIVVSGHNARIGWGITNGGWDVMEQYHLKLDPADSNRYWLDGKWQQMETIRDTILVKGDAPVVKTSQYTVFGRVVRKNKIVYAAHWHPEYNSSAVRALWRVMHAGDWEQFRDALRLYDYPAQNFAYGDVKGNIGIISAGKMPLKPAGYAGGLLDGTVTPVWNYIPFDSLPQAYNPQRGYLFSANQEPVRGPYYFSSHWYEDLYRPRRIHHLLANGTGLTVQHMRAMQLDVMDLSAKDINALLLKYTQPGNLSAQWKGMLQWDGNLLPTSDKAGFYKTILRSAGILAKEVATQLGVKTGPSLDQLTAFLLNRDSLHTGASVLHSKSLFNRWVAIADSVYRHRDMNEGAFTFYIPQITFLPGFDLQVDGVGGSENAVNVNADAHPVIRTVIELDSTGIRSYMVSAGGQSGRINERQYMQQLNDWKENNLHKTQFGADTNKLQMITTTLYFNKSH